MFERVLQRPPVPQPDVIEGGAIGAQIQCFDRVLGLKLSQLNLLESKSAPRPGDVVFDVRRLAAQLIWFDNEAGDISRHQINADDINRERNRERQQQQAQAAFRECIDNRDRGGDKQRDGNEVERRQQIVGFGKGDAGKSLMILPEVRKAREISAPGKQDQEHSQREPRLRQKGLLAVLLPAVFKTFCGDCQQGDKRSPRKERRRRA